MRILAMTMTVMAWLAMGSETISAPVASLANDPLETIRTDHWGAILCTPECWDCYGHQLRVVGGTLASFATCGAAPATGVTAAGCATAVTGTLHTAISALPACASCATCWCAVDPLCTPPGGGGGSEPVECPPQTVPASPGACASPGPCCCRIDRPDVCHTPGG